MSRPRPRQRNVSRLGHHCRRWRPLRRAPMVSVPRIGLQIQAAKRRPLPPVTHRCQQPPCTSLRMIRPLRPHLPPLPPPPRHSNILGKTTSRAPIPQMRPLHLRQLLPALVLPPPAQLQKHPASRHPHPRARMPQQPARQLRLPPPPQPPLRVRRSHIRHRLSPHPVHPAVHQRQPLKQRRPFVQRRPRMPSAHHRPNRSPIVPHQPVPPLLHHHRKQIPSPTCVEFQSPLAPPTQNTSHTSTTPSRTSPFNAASTRTRRHKYRQCSPPNGRVHRKNSCASITPKNAWLASAASPAQQHHQPNPPQLKTSRTTFPYTSVNRKSRPLYRYVSRSWSSPSRCKIVACKSCTCTCPFTVFHPYSSVSP